MPGSISPPPTPASTFPALRLPKIWRAAIRRLPNSRKFSTKIQTILSAIDGIGSILFQMGGQPFDPKKFEESKTYHQRHIQLKPEDPEPYYWIGVIDWTLAFRANGEMRLAYNKDNIKKQVKDTDPLPPAIRGDYAPKYGPMIEEGITDLQKAIHASSGLRRRHGLPQPSLSPQGRRGRNS